ncbi:hypothetical protein [Mycolicibacterium komossense]|uniref:Uncharacterized protein n=1 Tax=Mycolicibacterium komossense TaxID=1779 RepID=A0ABT3CCM6_9MYCO|nr:hypothetical protein [Mycolicibacterium komossense]MCV7227196.1 hypothetical protein [Mycolicibacterium komossense]
MKSGVMPLTSGQPTDMPGGSATAVPVFAVAVDTLGVLALGHLPACGTEL